MQLEGSNKRKSIWFDDDMWEEVKKIARQLSVKFNTDISASDFVRGATAYMLEHPDLLEVKPKG